MQLLLILGLAALGGSMVLGGTEDEDADNEAEPREQETLKPDTPEPEPPLPDETEVVTIVEPITGTEDADTLSGSEFDDQIDALAGDDVVSGLAGDDMISAEDGNDSLDGGEGNDSLIGGEGNDTLIGGDGADSMEGGLGDDVFWGVEDSFNEFHIIGKPSSSDQEVDTMQGGEGDDTLIMGSGDIAEGGEGADTFASGTWIDSDNLPVVEDFDITQDVFEIHVPEWVSEKGTPGSFADGTVAVEPDSDKGEGWFTVTYDGEPMASVFGQGMNTGHVNVVESRYIEPEFEPSEEVL